MADSLFGETYIPLAEKLRPRKLEDVLCQEHILGEGRPLRIMIETDRIRSCLFYGPAGTGKTTVARIMAERTSSIFVKVNAVASSVGELKEIISRAKSARLSGKKTVLFIDEFHRFNRSQQDYLLPFVEDGTVILVGATAANPFFYISSPLLSRLVIFEFRPLDEKCLEKIAKKALNYLGREYRKDFLRKVVSTAGGDARTLINVIELLDSVMKKSEPFTAETVDNLKGVSIPGKKYDSSGDYHYDVASAFIKSVRGGDPDSALLWMIRMIEGGEDPRFIARRIAILASEDIGNSDPFAVVLASAVAYLVDFVGMPEAKIILSQAVTYMASTSKSNSSYLALKRGEKLLKELDMRVPIHLMDSSYRGAELLGRGEGYVYPHDHGGYFPQLYLEEKDFWKLLKNGFLYEPEGSENHSGKGNFTGNPEIAFSRTLTSRRKTLLREFFKKHLRLFASPSYDSLRGEKNRKIVASLMSFLEKKDLVFAFYPTTGEPEIGEFLEEIWNSGSLQGLKSRVLLPVFGFDEETRRKLGLEGTDMSYSFYFGRRRLRKGSYGIMMPDSEPLSWKEIIKLLAESRRSIFLVPAIAFDEDCFRLGRGAGYYDRFLRSLRKESTLTEKIKRKEIIFIGVAFSWQIVRRLPRTDHDEPVDAVLTDVGFSCKRFSFERSD